MSGSGFALEIPGQPVPSGRPRFARVGQGVRTYPHPGDAAGKQAVTAAWLAAGRPKVDGLYTCQIRAVFPRPKSHWCKSGLSAAGKRSRVPRPDLDNLAKLALDAMMELGATPDDSRCVALTVSKQWAAGRDDPGTTAIWVESR